MSWDGLVEIFNPGHQHLRQERDRKRIEAQIPGTEGDGLTRVDLEDGVVHIAATTAGAQAGRANPMTRRAAQATNRRRRQRRRVTLPDGAVPDILDLDALAQRLTSVSGVVGAVLGGSRARGEHMPDSDVDLGIYYRDDLDIEALGALAREVAGPDAQVTKLGEWGPWVDGGAWSRDQEQRPSGATGSTSTGSTAMWTE
jgi:hypothetical protein